MVCVWREKGEALLCVCLRVGHVLGVRLVVWLEEYRTLGLEDAPLGPAILAAV